MLVDATLQEKVPVANPVLEKEPEPIVAHAEQQESIVFGLWTDCSVYAVQEIA